MVASTNRAPARASDVLAPGPHRGRCRLRLAKQGPQVSEVPGGRSPKLARVEAVLFAAGEPLSTRRIVDAANLADGTEARALVQELKALYEADRSAFTIDNIAGGWQLRTRPQFASWLEKLHPNRHPTRLSQPALETLTVVAYRQPILRADVESIRGVSCGEMLRQLIDRGLVRIVGHHDSLGRPLLYGTTRRFLEVFGLGDLADLPMTEALRQPARSCVDTTGTQPEIVGPGDPTPEKVGEGPSKPTA
jgi:segregation and condensation protein B